MAREFAKKFYNSKQWQQCRKAFIASKMGICERCGKPNCKQVHHKEELSELNIDNPEITLNWANFELLCDVCHGVETNSKYGVLNEGLAFAADGDVVPVTPPCLTP